MSGSTVRFGDVCVEKLVCSNYKNLQMIRYYDEPLLVQSPWIHLTHYGIPKTDKFNTTEESRRYLRVPLHDDDDDFTVFIKKLDEFFGSDEFRNKYLDDKQQKFQYFKLFKESSNEKYPPSLKLKMDVKDNDIKTVIFNHEPKADVGINVKNMDDVAKAIPYKSDVRFLFKVHRLWIQPSMKGYGVILKLRRIQVRKSNVSGNNEEFIDTDDDSQHMEDTSVSNAST